MSIQDITIPALSGYPLVRYRGIQPASVYKTYQHAGEALESYSDSHQWSIENPKQLGQTYGNSAMLSASKVTAFMVKAC